MPRPHTDLERALGGDHALAFWPILQVVLAALFPLTIAYAQSPLVAELEMVATSYHIDPTRLDHIRQGLEQTITTDSRVENLVALARVNYLWGGIRATTDDERLAAYDRGRQVAKRAVELAPKHVEGHYWYALNTGRWGQVRGVVRSLFLLSTVQEEIHTILQLEPEFTPVYLLAGYLFYELPRVLGGNLQQAEKMFRKGLEQDPHFTAMRVGLGKTLIKLGRTPEAQRELLSVLEEKAPSNPADWTLNDSSEARELLISLKSEL